MRAQFSLALFGCFTFASIAQTQSANVYRIHKLILTSPDLPTGERQAIIHAFQGSTYNLDELAGHGLTGMELVITLLGITPKGVMLKGAVARYPAVVSFPSMARHC